MAAAGLLEAHLESGRALPEAEIRAGLEGTLCPCTGYAKIVSAVEVAARRMRASLAPSEAGA
jgi:aerobic-type carbon monoxide dehydrogenase small subunit (CoxS/CutS family)